MSGWVQHSGNGCPLPQGTLIDVRHFNGDVTRGVRVGGFTVDLDGSLISRSRGRWSGWDYSDGGPMAPKFKAYRVCVDGAAHERNAAMFRSWLNVRQEELA
ncbi:hypothetical protein [Sphingomonas fennica]|uniref:Uncharacterized protein n=1 Tax=Edaphosphingomonas fennica TaxID=114404 RepID=A0A2T4HVX1_9SPHN|nr:hypothetical protein [Sphingomonas fennica]PTD19897.1 hypothetical protein CV103_11960 [Sphingomonas fennica]